MWISSGRLTNPTLNQILVSSGPLNAGPKNAQILLAATVAFAAELQWTDSVAVVKQSQIIAVPAFGFQTLFAFLREFDVAQGDVLRVIAVAAASGAVSCSIDGTF